MRLYMFCHVLLAVLIAAILPASASAQRTLRYTDHQPLGEMRTDFIRDVFFTALEKESEGRIKVEAHWNGELSTGYDALRVIREGRIADFGIVVPEYDGEALPLHQIFKSFPTGPTGARQVEFFRRAYAEIPALPKELAHNNVVNVLFATGYPVAFFSTAPLASLADIRGDSWRTASFWHRDFLENAGAVPVSMPWGPGIFTALQDRTLDGLMVNIDSGYALDIHEAAPHVLASRDLWLGHVYLLVMNREVWESLASEDKNAVRRAAATAHEALGAVMDHSFDTMVSELRNEGATVRILKPQEVDAFAAATRYREVQEAWVKEQQAKGVTQAGPVMAELSALLEKPVK